VIQHDGTTDGFEGTLMRCVDDDLYVIVLCNDRERSKAAARTLALVAVGKRTVATPVDVQSGQLAKLAGQYEPPRGGKVTVRVEGNALVLEPDAEAVIGLMTGGGKLDKDAKLAKRAEKVIDLLSAGDAVGIKTVISSQWPNWSRQLIDGWAEWIDERGKLKKSECLGSKGASTFVRLVHERRSVTWTLHWKDDVLNGYTINGEIPEAAQFRARSSSEFVYEETEKSTPTEFTLSFECDSGSTARTFSLESPNVKFKAKRVH
jgi:hypothetical protein